jgi:chemotaxis protein CheD
LAHIVLPSSTGANGPAPKFADTAVPEMIEQMCAAGARRDRLEAVYAGGARMFQVGAGSLDIGARNGEAVQEELAQVRIPVRATAIGGTRGRTVRVAVGHCTVTVQEAGGERDTMYDGRQPHVHRVSATLPPSLRVQPAGVRA